MDIVVDGIIFQTQPHGGISRIFREILPRMCDRDDSLHFTILTSGRCKQDLPTHSRIQRISLFPVERYLRPNLLWHRFIPLMNACIQTLRVGNAKGRVWHSTYYTIPLRWNGPFFITALDMIHERFPHLFGKEGLKFRQQKRKCLQRADAIISISQSTKDDICTFYGINKEKIWVVPLACGDIFLQPDSHVSKSIPITQKPFLLYVGIRTHYKNTSLLIKAYTQWKRHKEVDLIIVGRPWSVDEIKELSTLGIKDRVHLLGYIDDHTLKNLYHRAIALVYPSLYEGFGIPLLEAMVCGCPIIASRIPSTIEVAGECPIYFEPTNVDDLINTFEVALSEGRDSNRVRMGYERNKQYSWDKTAAQTLEVYRAVSDICKT